MTQGDGSPGKRDAILAAAARLFSEKGFHPARVEEIAAEAGVGKGTVYEYFPSKEALFEEVFKASIEAYVRTLEGAMAPGGALREAVARVVAIHLDFVERHAPLARIAMERPAGFGPELKRWMYGARARIRRILQRALEEGARRGETGPVDPALAAVALLGVLNSLAAERLFAPADAARPATPPDRLAPAGASGSPGTAGPPGTPESPRIPGAPGSPEAGFADLPGLSAPGLPEDRAALVARVVDLLWHGIGSRP